MRKTLHSQDHAILIGLLRNARKEAGLTQQEVARKLQQPQSFVAKYEGGERRLDMLEFIEVARALEQDPIQLLELLLGAICRIRAPESKD